MRKVVWSADAEKDYLGIVNYLAGVDARSADIVSSYILDAVAGLGVIPTGRPGRVAGMFEKSVRGAPYIVAYTLEGGADGGTVGILRIVHAACDWPKGKPPPR